MKTLKQWLEARAAKAKEVDDMIQSAKAESRDLSVEDGAKVDGLLNELKDIDTNIVRARSLENEAAVRAMANAPVHSGVEGNVTTSQEEQRDLRKFSLVRGLRLMSQGKPLDGIEAEVHQEAEKDARSNGVQLEGFGVPAFINQRGQTVTGQTTAPGDQGGVSVPTELNGLIEAIWAKSFLNEVGARRLTGLQGNQDFLVQDTVPTIQELTEIEEMDEDEIKMSKFTMAPNRRGTSIPFSKQLLLQTSLDVESLILDNIRKGLDYKLNAEAIIKILAAITSGNGNLLELGDNGDRPTYDDIVALEGLLDGVDTNFGSLAYLTNAKVKSILKRTQIFTGTSGEPVWKDNQLNGYKAVTSNIVPSNLVKGTSGAVCSAVVYGDFSHLYLGMWGGADFVVDPLTRAKKGEIIITANMFWDIEVARAKSFAGIKDALTTTTAP